jgi:serine/threonine-protein kinase
MDKAGPGPLAARLAETLAGAYELEGELGRGGMGIVYSARDLSLRRRVAIKLLPPDLAFRPEVRTRFIREAQTAARLSHPHIVPIHSVGDEGGRVYFVMGYVDGESLAARLRRRERLPVDEVRRIMKETADALGLAHAVGVIHRDIKPDNILLEGTRRRVMVTDFGIAKAREAGVGTLTGTGVAIGTPAYMSPEQALGEREIDARADIYSLGVVAHEMITGEVPFKAPTLPGSLMKQMTEPVPDVRDVRSDCPEELAVSIQRCLEKNPADRWPTADALRRALDNRTSVAYRSRAAVARGPRGRSRPQARDQEWWEWFEGEEKKPRPRGRPPVQARRGPAKPATTTRTEPGIVKNFRGNFASYLSVIGGLLVVNVFTGIGEPWVLIPAVLWGIGLGHQYGKLWTAGYSMRDVLNRPPAPDALPTPAGRAAASGRLSQGAPREVSTGEYGVSAVPIRQMQKDRAAIMQMVENLPSSERAMLPDVVPTVDALLGRAVELAQTLRQMETSVDDGALARLDARIEELKRSGADPERDRRLELLERQHAALAELIQRRERVEAQFESCVLAVQNVRFDVLRLRSAGVAAVLDDLTSATQKARALQLDVEAALAAAAEIREALGEDLTVS